MPTHSQVMVGQRSEQGAADQEDDDEEEDDYEDDDYKDDEQEDEDEVNDVHNAQAEVNVESGK